MGEWKIMTQARNKIWLERDPTVTCPGPRGDPRTVGDSWVTAVYKHPVMVNCNRPSKNNPSALARLQAGAAASTLAGIEDEHVGRA